MTQHPDIAAFHSSPIATLHIEVRLDGGNVREFHRLLLMLLARAPGVSISVDARPADNMRIPGADALFQLETLIHGLADRGAAGRIDVGDLEKTCATGKASADLVIDLCGDAVSNTGRVWRVSYNGATGDDALLASILEGATPVVTISEGERIISSGRLGSDNGGITVAAFGDMLARVATLVAAAAKGAAASPLPSLPGDAGERIGTAPSAMGMTRIAAKQAARRIVQIIYRLCCNAPHWKVGWRDRAGGPDLLALRTHPDAGWRVLPDDGRRFYADPFPIEHKGRMFLFVEDFPHRTAKGVISAVEFGSEGPVGRPESVLELPFHLSYPFVFEAEGEMWMIPESSSNGTVDLYRATAFPRGWVREATLLSGLEASDATLARHGDRWWMFATVREAGGAFSDSLHLWSAPDFRGPWTPHPGNPVLVDIVSARPAGRMVYRDGILLRPVQDCRAGYGAALGIARVLRLDETGFEQVIEVIIGPGPLWPGRKLHTLNGAGDLEFIDGSAISPRWASWSRTT